MKVFESQSAKERCLMLKKSLRKPKKFFEKFRWDTQEGINILLSIEKLVEYRDNKETKTEFKLQNAILIERGLLFLRWLLIFLNILFLIIFLVITDKSTLLFIGTVWMLGSVTTLLAWCIPFCKIRKNKKIIQALRKQLRNSPPK